MQGENEGKVQKGNDMKKIEEMWSDLIDMSLMVKRKTKAYTQVSMLYTAEGEPEVRVKVNDYGLRFPRYNRYYNVMGENAEREYAEAMSDMREILRVAEVS